MQSKLYALFLLIITNQVVYTLNVSPKSDSLSDNSVVHILFYGRSGVGKSFLCNKLKASGQEEFIESQTKQSVTSNIESRLAFNGDLVTDVPGFFDSNGPNMDQQQQASIVDYVKNKTIRCIVFVYSDRHDSAVKSALQNLKNSDLRNNIIMVRN